MKKLKKILCTSLVTVLLVISYPSPINALTDSNQYEVFKQDYIVSETEKFLVERAELIEGNMKFSKSKNDFFQPEKRTNHEDVLREKILEYHQTLKNNNLHYSLSKVSLNILDTEEIDQETYAIIASEEVFMKMEGHDTETGYGNYHKFIYKLKDDGWKLTEDKILEPYSMVLPKDSELFVDKDSDYVKNIGEIIDSESSIENEDKIEYVNEPKNENSRAGYNYDAIANYAERYWSNYNPAYRSFSQDCTNFVSQAMYAGGWSQVSGFYQSSSVWWYNSSNQSYTWAGAENWAAFALNTGRTKYYRSIDMLRKGDVLQLKANGSTTKDHTMIVSYYSGSPYLTYHTSNRYRVPLQEVVAAWGNASFYPHQT